MAEDSSACVEDRAVSELTRLGTKHAPVNGAGFTIFGDNRGNQESKHRSA
jgi:hypothetical protein